MRTRLLGRSAAPLLVIAPRPFQRVLTAVRKLEPMALRYVDCACTCAGALQVHPVGVCPAERKAVNLFRWHAQGL